MNPGRELDRLIAEKVMGWKPNYPGGWPHPPKNISNRKRYLDKEGCSVIPSYSTDIAAAWTVVERIQKQGYPLAPFRELWRDDADLEKMPFQICIAAMKELE